jgi:hypothetical protein
LAVVELIPGRVEEVRLVRLRIASGVLLRPIKRVYPLEIRDEEPLKPDQLSVEMALEPQETAASLEKDNE